MNLVELEGIGPVAVLPFQPEAPLKETLDWKTDLMTAWDGTEYRQEIRHAPRQSFQMVCPVRPEHQPLAQHLLYGARDAEHWGVPVWMEAQEVGALSLGTTTIPAETAYRDFRVGGWVLVWDNPERWRVARIKALTDDRIELAEELGQTMFRAWAAPLRIARVGATPDRLLNGHRSELALVFDVEDNVRLPDPSVETYEGYDLVLDESLTTNSVGVSEKTTSNVELLDYDSGLVAKYSRWLRPKVIRPRRIITQGARELWELRQWLHRRSGRLRPFWLPSGENDLRLGMSGTITNHLMFFNDGYMSMAVRPEHVAIQTLEGTWYARKLLDPRLTGAIVTAELSEPLPNVDSGSIFRVSFLGLKRLDTDKIDLQYVGGGVCTCDMNILELES